MIHSKYLGNECVLLRSVPTWAPIAGLSLHVSTRACSLQLRGPIPHWTTMGGGGNRIRNLEHNEQASVDVVDG